MRRWSPAEDAQVIEAAANNSDNILKAFGVLSAKIGRSVDAIVTRFYNVLNKQK